MATFNGSGGGNNYTGTTDDDTMFGNGGNDTLDGGLGNDTLDGGSGNDVLVYDGGVDTIDGGDGRDVVNIWFDSSESNDITIDMTQAETSVGDTLFNGTVLKNIEDVGYVQTGAGDDTLIVKYQRATVLWDGGAGDDRFVADFSGAAGPIYSFAQNSTYQLQSFDGSRLAAVHDVEAITLIGGMNSDILVGMDGDDVINGFRGNDSLAGGNGNDVLDGGFGADVMTGGRGDDTFYVDSAGDQASEWGGQGTDEVRSTVSYAIGKTSIENLTLLGRAAIDGTGNSLDNYITGNGAANTLDGGDGNDVLDGDRGTDLLIGGDGDDTYIVDRATDVVVETKGGTDTVLAWSSYTLSDHVENLTLIGTGNTAGIGNILDNVITGNSGANRLTGGSGMDTFVFLQGSGADRVKDFSVSDGDWININDYTHGSVNDPSVTISTSGANTLIDLGSGNIITVVGIRANNPDLLSHIIW